MIKILTKLFLVLFIALMILSFFWQAPIDYLKELTVNNSEASILVFIFLMILSTVFAPLTVLPIVPVVGELLGHFQTAVYSFAGWMIGSTIAFWLARHLGKPLLVKFVSEKDLIKYHKYIPEDIHFWWTVFLRMIIPVDILSYAIGLFTNMTMSKYLLASAIGILPFVFIFSYGFKIVLFDNIGASLLTVAFIIVILSSLWYLRKKKKI